MTAAPQATQFGRSIERPNDAWLAKQAAEPILDPDLPIIDTHHHFWDRPAERPGHRYLLDDLLADLNTGHKIEATVFLECRSMYRAGGPPEMRPVGETEFVAGLAAMSASAGYGPTRIATGIVSYADLTLGERVEPVLEAHIRAGGGRFRGVRHSAGWDQSDTIGNSRPDSSRISTSGRIFATASPGSRRAVCRSTPGSITRSSPTWSIWRARFRLRQSSWAIPAACSATAPMPARRTRCLPTGNVL